MFTQAVTCRSVQEACSLFGIPEGVLDETFVLVKDAGDKNDRGIPIHVWLRYDSDTRTVVVFGRDEIGLHTVRYEIQKVCLNKIYNLYKWYWRHVAAQCLCTEIDPDKKTREVLLSFP
jgi:hypothetical protein